MTTWNYDTHTTQRPGQEAFLTELDQAIEAFYFGTMGGQPIAGVSPISRKLASRTILLTTSEFGRRIGENGAGAAGTDHGAAGPLFIVGPPNGSRIAGRRLVPGLHGDHPKMGTPLAPADNLMMTTDVRRVYQSVLQEWLHNPEPTYQRKHKPISGLFV